MSSNESFYVYLLECTDKTTYVGATVNLDHRLRQHNGEIKGGAHATTIKVKRGHQWNRVLHIEGFPTWQCALQFEWALKFQSRKFAKQRLYSPMECRMLGLEALLSLDQSTSKSIPYTEYNPQIVWENDRVKQMYDPSTI